MVKQRVALGKIDTHVLANARIHYRIFGHRVGLQAGQRAEKEPSGRP